MASIDILLDRADRVYAPGEKVTGVVRINTTSSLKHQGIKLTVEGNAALQLSARSIGLFEAFYSTLKPVPLLNYEIEVSPGGKVPAGGIEYPFEFSLTPIKDMALYDTYHGVYVNVQYMISADMTRGMMAKNLKANKEYLIQTKADKELRQTAKKQKPFHFKVSPESLQNVKETSKQKLPKFLFDGFLKHTTCSVTEPLQGELTIQESEVQIKSIELQLVRVESCTYMEGEAREATEIQNIQIADGNVVKGLAIPIHMVFPRLFTCATTLAKAFKVEFEVNLIVLFNDNHMVTENFPLKLYR